MVEAKRRWPYRPPQRYPLVEPRQALIDARHSSGLTQEKLAAEIGIRRDTLDMIELGKRHPSYALMLRWARALGMSLAVWEHDETLPAPKRGRRRA